MMRLITVIMAAGLVMSLAGAQLTDSGEDTAAFEKAVRQLGGSAFVSQSIEKTFVVGHYLESGLSQNWKASGNYENAFALIPAGLYYPDGSVIIVEPFVVAQENLTIRTLETPFGPVPSVRQSAIQAVLNHYQDICSAHPAECEDSRRRHKVAASK